jgi:hypothetical protein
MTNMDRSIPASRSKKPVTKKELERLRKNWKKADSIKQAGDADQKL